MVGTATKYKLCQYNLEYETGDKLTCREGRVRITDCQTAYDDAGAPDLIPVCFQPFVMPSKSPASKIRSDSDFGV